MKKRLILTAGLSALLLAGCSTSYHQKGFFGDGYTDYRVNQDKFAVTFRGNEYTDSEDVRRFALTRAAELTLQNGFRYFKVLSEKDVSRQAVETSTTEHDESVVTRKVKKQAPGIDLMIRCFDQEPDGDAIDAREFLSYNQPKK